MNDITNMVVALMVVRILAAGAIGMLLIAPKVVTEDATKKLKFSSRFFLQCTWYNTISF